MKLRWNYEDVKNRYDYVYYLYKPKDDREKMYLELSSELYSDVLKLCDKPLCVEREEFFNTFCFDFKLFLNEVSNFRKVLSEVSIDFAKFFNGEKLSSDSKITRVSLDIFDECFMQLPRDVRGFLEKIYKNIDFSCWFLNDSLKFKKIDISNEELRDEVYKFFSSINKDYVKMLDYLFKKSLVQVNSKREVKKSDLDNCCSFDPIWKIPYCSITDTKDVRVISSFNHELCHGLEFLAKGMDFLDNSLFYLDEANAVFISFLTNFMKLEDDEYLKDFANYFSYFRSCFADSLIARHLSKKIYLSKKENNQSLACNFGVTCYGDYFSSTNFVAALRYSTSCVIALHLLRTFESDPEKAFYFFDKSLKYNGNSSVKYFNQIEFDYKDFDYALDLVFGYDKFLEDELVRRRIRK